MELEKKICSECQEEKYKYEFYINKRVYGGVMNKCKICMRKQVRKSLLKNNPKFPSDQKWNGKYSL